MVLLNAILSVVMACITITQVEQALRKVWAMLRQLG